MILPAAQLQQSLREFVLAASRSNHPSWRDADEGEGLRIVQQHGYRWLRRQTDWLEMGCCGRQPLTTATDIGAWRA